MLNNSWLFLNSEDSKFLCLGHEWVAIVKVHFNCVFNAEAISAITDEFERRCNVFLRQLESERESVLSLGHYVASELK